MKNRRPTAISYLWCGGGLAFAVILLHVYGWFPALNASIPFVGALLWAAVMTLAAWGAGHLVAGRRFNLDPSTLDGIVLRLLAGTAVLATTTGALAVLHLLRPETALGALAVWASTGAILLHRRRDNGPLGDFVPALPWLAVIVFAGGISLAAATTFAPFYDQWHYHLGFPYHWLREGTLVTYERQAYSYFPANMGLLYSYALAGPGGWAAQVIHWWMGALTAAGSAAIAQRLGAPVAGRTLAAATFLATPTVVQMGSLAGSDLGAAAFAVGGLLAVLRLIGNRQTRRSTALYAGLAAGFSAGCKYTAIATVVIPVGVMAVAVAITASDGPRRMRRGLAVGLAFAIGVGAALSPWLARNWVVTGNPVYPYFAVAFGVAPPGTGEEGDELTSGIGTFGLSGDKVAEALTLGTFSRHGHAGDIGPVYLLFLPLVLTWWWRNRARAEAWVAVGYGALAIPAWAAGPPLGRYLLPVLAIGAGLIGESWSDLSPRWPPAIRLFAASVLVVILAANCNPVRGEYLFDQLRCFLGAEESEIYLESECTQIEPFAAANRLLPAAAKVLLIGEPRPFGINRDVVVEDQFGTPLLVELANSSKTADEIADGLQKLGVTHLLWNATEAARIAGAESRQTFLECDSVASQARLDRFLADFTALIARGSWWELAGITTTSAPLVDHVGEQPEEGGIHREQQ